MKNNKINPSNDILKEIEGAIKRKEALDSVNDSKIKPRRNDINVADFNNIQKQEDHNKIGELQKQFSDLYQVVLNSGASSSFDRKTLTSVDADTFEMLFKEIEFLKQQFYADYGVRPDVFTPMDVKQVYLDGKPYAQYEEQPVAEVQRDHTFILDKLKEAYMA